MKTKRFVRNFHRYLSIFVSIQLLLWTISGIYFAYNKIELIRGEQYRLPKAINDEDFFVGTVILKTPDENTIDGIYEIVDGQQRLTSFYLLCIALKTII